MTNDDKLKLYFDLWKSENPIKTQKLMAYFASQSILGLAATQGILAFLGFSLIGFFWSVWWVNCIGRTIAYQKVWKYKINSIDCTLFPTEDDLQKKPLPWYGRIGATKILLFPPIAGAIVWFALFIVAFIEWYQP